MVIFGGENGTSLPKLKTHPNFSYFEQYGKIKYCQVKLDPSSGQSRGFGFILYEQTDSVDNVIKNLPHTGLLSEIKTAYFMFYFF